MEDSQSEAGNSGLCSDYKDFLSPSNSTGTVQKQAGSSRHLRCCDEASALVPTRGNTDALRCLLHSTPPRPLFGLGIFMWKNIKTKNTCLEATPTLSAFGMYVPSLTQRRNYAWQRAHSLKQARPNNPLPPPPAPGCFRGSLVPQKNRSQ